MTRVGEEDEDTDFVNRNNRTRGEGVVKLTDIVIDGNGGEDERMSADLVIDGREGKKVRG